MSNYQSFEQFEAAVANSKKAVITRQGIVIIINGVKRRFWSRELMRYLGKEVDFFIDPTGLNGDEAIVFNLNGQLIGNIPEFSAIPILKIS
jgi:hypothetical protein